MGQEVPILRSLEIIERRISEKLTVAGIAGSVYFSKDHYQRLFREVVGDSVMEYVTRRRLTLAGEALLRTGRAIVDVAVEFGYDSREGFTRSFKAYMGVSPGDYRKYGLAAISQNIAKERFSMTYSKTTNEILRELNGFVAQARGASAAMRKCEVPGFPTYLMFWNRLADRIDALADSVQARLEGIGSIAERPDEITNRFAIVRAVDDAAFEMNLLAFNAGLMVARSAPDQAPAQEPFERSCRELARAASVTAGKVTAFLGELAALIFADMRRAAAEKLADVTDAGHKAVAGVAGYGYIQGEVAHLAKSLEEKPPEDITWQWLDDCLFKLNIIASAAQLQDVPRMPSDAAVFDGLGTFAGTLRDAADFFRALPSPEESGAMERTEQKALQDFTFQQNILLFYLRGEIEKMGDIPGAEQKAALRAICGQIDDTIHLTLAAPDQSARGDIARKLHAVHAGLLAEADKLGDKGGAIRFLAGEYRALADHIRE